MRFLVVAGIGLSLLGLVRRADAIVCKTRAGTVVMRDACRAREVTIDFSVVGPSGAQGAPGADGPDGAWTVRILDALAREVGPAVNVEWYLPSGGPSLQGTPVLHAFIRHDAVGGAALLGVDYAGTPTGTVYYTSNDCTGPPMVFGATFLPVLAVIGDTVFVPGPPASATMTGSSETAGIAGGCSGVTPRGGCCRTGMGTYSGLVLATTTSFQRLGITPPLLAVGPPTN